ncbi:collagen alpha-1(II) chain-like [Harpia harpyja]|uniref:collagen alpha-1(II) chain-like n=1 Tax=Harpia harpyja TaxID=202280 RepID=UPI0022B0AE36|nr:collagen alpha-1(II) chain-like [Harpia harpyja]
MSPLPSPRRNYAARPGGARRQWSVTVAAGASALRRVCGGRCPPASGRGGSACLPPGGAGCRCPPRPPEATVRQSAAIGGKRGGLGASSPSAPAPPPPAVPPGAALTDMAYPSLESPSPVYPRAAEWVDTLRAPVEKALSFS